MSFYGSFLYFNGAYAVLLGCILNFINNASSQTTCLVEDKASPNYCSICKVGFYPKSGPTYYATVTTTISSFPVSECLPAIAAPEPKLFFLTSQSRSCGSPSNCSGSSSDPFDSLIYALNSIEKAIYMYQSVDVTLLLLTPTHYVLNAETAERIFLRRTRVRLFIRPALCSETNALPGCFPSPSDKVLVYLKTTKLRIFVSCSLQITNIVFKGNDLHYFERYRNRDTPSCLTQNSVCCNDASLSLPGGDGCGVFAEEVIMSAEIADGGMPFFNIEPFIESDEIAVLSFKDCEFINFHLYTTYVNSIVGFMPQAYFRLNFSGGSLEASLLLGGLFTPSSANFLDVFRDQGLLTSYKQRMANAASEIELREFAFEKINKNRVEAFYFSQFMYRGLFSASNLQGQLSIVKCRIKEARMTFNKALLTSVVSANQLFGCLFVFDGANMLGISLKIVLDSCELSDNEADYLIYISTATNLQITNTSFARNSGPYYNILVKDSAVSIKGLNLLGSLAQSGFLTFSNSNLLISDIYGVSISAQQAVSVLFKDTSTISATLETIFATAAVKTKYCSSVLKIFNVSLVDSRVLLVDSMNCIHNLTVSGCSLVNTPYTERGESLKESLNFINSVCEVECNFTLFHLKKVVFEVMNLILVGGARTHVLAGFKVEDSTIAFLSWCRQVLTYNIAITSTIADIWIRNYTNAGYYAFNYDYVATGQGFSVMIKNIDIQGVFFRVADNGVFNLRVARAEIYNLRLLEISTANFINFRGSIVNPDFIIDNFTFLVMENSFSFVIITASETIKNFTLKNAVFDCRRPLLVVTALNIIKTTVAEISNVTVRNIKTGGASALAIGVDVNNYIIKNCTFFNNSAKNYGADLNIQTSPGSLATSYFPFNGVVDCRFSGSFGSGSINIEKFSAFNIENSTFYNITSENEGAAIKFSTQTSGRLKGLIFKNTQSRSSGGCLYLRGTNLTLVNVTIYMSASKTYGGSIYAQQSLLWLVGCEFSFGSASVGGFLFLDQTVTEISKSLLNTSEGRSKGGHIYGKGASLKLSESRLVKGFSEAFGSSLYLEAVYLSIAFSSIENCLAKLAKGKGIGTIYMIGQRNANNTFASFSCLSNVAMTAACLYSKDADISILNNTIFQNNVADDNSVVETASSYVVSRMTIKNISFRNNVVKEAVLSIKKTNLQINGCLFESAASSTFVFTENSRVEIAFSVFITEGKSSSATSATAPFLIRAKKIDIFEPLVLRDINFLCGGVSQGFYCHECDNVHLQNISISMAAAVGEAIYLSESQTVVILESLVNGSLGGALKAVDTNVSISGCSLLSNKGPGVYALRVSEYEKMTVEVRDSKFQGNTGENIFARKIVLLVENCTLRGLLTSPSLGMQLTQVISVKILNSQLSNFYQRGTISIDQTSTAISEIIISNSLFANSSNLLSGGFIFLSGSVAATISNCSFFNGSTAESGGALYYDCAIAQCVLFIDGSCSFTLNKAKKTGGAIKAVASLPRIDPKAQFSLNSANDQIQDLSSFGFQFLIIQNVDDSASLKEISKNMEISEFKKIAVERIEIFSGYKQKLCLLLIDHFQNILLEQSDKLVEIHTVNSKEVFLERNIERLSQGVVCYKGLIITAKPGRLFNVSIKYETFSQFFEVFSKYCPRGDIYRDLKCVTCEENYFSLDSNSSDQENGRNATDVCQPCPKNAICKGADSLWPEAGFWILNVNSSVVVVCSDSAACRKFNSSKEYFSGNKCGHGYQGNACANCIKDFSKNAFGECIECNAGTHLIFFLKLLVACGFMFLDNMNLLEIGQVTTLEKERRPLMKILVFHVGYLTIITQTTMNLGNMVQEVFRIFNSYLSVIPDDFIKLECFVENSSQEDLFQADLIVVTLTPIIYTLIVFFITCSHISIVRCLRNKRPSWKLLDKLSVNSMWTTPKGLITMVVCILIISVRNFYTKVLLTSFKLFHCIEIGPNFLFLQVDPDVECWGERHKKVFFSVFFPNIAIWGLGLPFLFFRVSRKGRRTVSNKSKGTIENSTVSIITVEPATRDRSSSEKKHQQARLSKISKEPAKPHSHLVSCETIQEDEMAKSRMMVSIESVPMVYLSEDYEQKYYFWESLIFLNIFVLSLTSQALSSFDDLSQGVIMISLFTGVFFINLKLSPYRDALIKRISIFSSIITVLTSLLASVASRNSDNDILRYGAIVILACANSFFYIGWIVAYLRTYKDIRKNKNISTLITIIEKKLTALSRQINIFRKSK